MLGEEVKRVIPNFTSYSGDAYHIPKEQYRDDVRAYRNAINHGKEDVMLNFEEGNTGWILVDDGVII